MANTTVTGASTTAVTLTEDDTANTLATTTPTYTTTANSSTAPSDDTLTVNPSESLSTTNATVPVTLNLSAAPVGNGMTGAANGGGQGVVVTNNGTISTVGSRVIDATSTAGGGTTTATGAEITLNNSGTIQSSGGNGNSKGDLFRVNYDMPSGSVNVYNTGTMSAGVNSNDSQGIRLGKVYTAKSILIDNGVNAGGTQNANAIITTTDADAIRPGGVDPGGTAANIGSSVINNYGTVTAHSGATAALGTISAVNGVDISTGQSVTVNNLSAGATISGDESGLGADVGNASTTTTPVTFAPNYNVNNLGTITGYNGAGVAANAATAGTTTTYSGTATINNSGVIQGEATGLLDNDGKEPGAVSGGGTVTNAAGVGVYTTNNATVYNAAGATISGTGVQNNGNGASFANSGSYAIDAGGTTAGQVTDLKVGNAVAVTGIDNYGTIQGNSGEAILLRDAAGTTNTISNYGTISGSSSGTGSSIQAITFGAGNDTLNLYAGESLTGTVTTGGGTDTLNLASNGTNTSGSITGISGFTNLNVKSGTWTVADNENFSGGENIAGGATLALNAAGSTSQVNFANTTSAATLSLSTAAQPANGGTFGGTLNRFGGNNVLDLQNFAYSASDTVSYANGKLTVSNGTTTESFTLANPTSTNYYLVSDGVKGTDVVVCFVTGTRIRIARGQEIVDVAVEALEVGDLAVTASGALRPIRWIGHREMDCRRHPRPHDAMPVRVAAHAFGADLPERDLYLSPGHPVLVGGDENHAGGHLVPIMCLINGTTVRRVAVDAVTYWHIELDAHDILLAEGLPAESYIDLGSRPWFAGAESALHDPDMALPGMPGRCRPVAVEGPVVEAERRRLDAVLVGRLTAACAWPESDFLSLPV